MTKARAVLWMIVVTLGASDCSCEDKSEGSSPNPRKPSNTKKIGCRFDSGDTVGTGTDGVEGKYTFVGAPTFDDPNREAVHPTVLYGKQHLDFVADVAGPPVRAQSQAGTFTEVTSLGAVFNPTQSGSFDIDLYASGAYVDSLWHRIVSAATGTLRFGRVSSQEPAVLEKRSVPLGVQLTSNDGGLDVVDETVVVSVQGGIVFHDPKVWYRWTVKTGDAGSTLQLSLASKQVLGVPVELPVVAAIDGVATTADATLTGGLLLPSDELDFCPYATSGAHEVVAAGEIDIDSAGAITVTKNKATGCYRIYPTDLGAASLVLSLDGVTRTYSLWVGDLDMGLPDLSAGADLSQVD